MMVRGGFISYRAISPNDDGATEKLTEAAREHLSENSTSTVFMQTDGAVLTRELKILAVAMDKDETEPRPKGEETHFERARITAGANKDVKRQSTLRRLMFSPLILRFLIAMRPLGRSYRASSFFKLSFITKVQEECAGVSCAALVIHPSSLTFP